MSSAAGSVTIQLDSKLATKLTGEHYSLELDPPLTCPFLAQPRARLAGLSFVNSFTNIDEHSDNTTVKLAWKLPTSSQLDTPYDDLEWNYLTFNIDDSYHDPASLESAIAKKIMDASNGGAEGSLWWAMERMVACKPAWQLPSSQYQAISTTGSYPGQRPNSLTMAPTFHATSRGFYYGNNTLGVPGTASNPFSACQTLFPNSRNDGTTIVIVIDETEEHSTVQQDKPANNRTTPSLGTNLIEYFSIGDNKGKPKWRNQLPTWLIGSTLQYIQDPHQPLQKYTGHMGDPSVSFENFKDASTELKLRYGLKIVGVHAAKNINGMGYPGIVRDTASDPTPLGFNGHYALELELPTDNAFQTHFAALLAGDYGTDHGVALLTSIDPAKSGHPFIATPNFGSGAPAAALDAAIGADKMQMVFTFTPPGYPTTQNSVIDTTESTPEAKAAARDEIANFKTGEPAYIAYGVSKLASPTLTDTSWGTALTGPEMLTVAQTAVDPAHYSVKHPNNVIPGSGAAVNYEQWERAVRPIAFIGDQAHGDRLSFAMGWPGVYVCKESTLFTKLLGFNAADLCTSTGSGPTKAEMAKQNPFMAPSGAVLDTKDRTLLQANPQKTDILTVRSLQFHCPTLAPPSYMPNGKMVGAQLASVPVDVAPNQLQNWSAMYDNSVPVDMHGQQINNIEFYLTNQDQQVQDMQGTNFNATIYIEWPDPAPPHLGEAGAETQIQDVSFYRR